jgi:hypothetical protein
METKLKEAFPALVEKRPDSQHEFAAAAQALLDNPLQLQARIDNFNRYAFLNVIFFFINFYAKFVSSKLRLLRR